MYVQNLFPLLRCKKIHRVKEGKKIKKINKVIDNCLGVLSGIAGLSLGFLLLGMCFSTFARFLFNKPFTNIVEYTAYCLAYITFLGAPQILKDRGHVALDILTQKLPEKVSNILGLTVNVVGAILCGVLFYYSALVVKDNIALQTKIMDSMGTPLFLVTIVIPIGMFFLTIQFIRNFYSDYHKTKENL